MPFILWLIIYFYFMIEIDRVFFLFLNGLAGRWFFLDFFIYFTACILPWFLIIVLFYALLRRYKKYKLLLIKIVSAGATSYLLVWIIRYFFPRLRPFYIFEHIGQLLPYKDTFSFPSGHAALLFSASTVLYLYNKKIGIAFYGLSLLIGFARIISGVHWPLDIILGALLGLLCGLFFSFVLKRKEKK